jgi:hypothetical protein
MNSIYRLKPWVFVINILVLVSIGIVVGVPMAIFGETFISLMEAGSGFEAVAPVFLCCLSPLFILMGLLVIQQLVNVVFLFFAYIKVTPEGIEQKYPGSIHIRSKWSDVDRFGTLFFNNVLYLNAYEELGLSLSLRSPFQLFRPKQRFISLSNYNGWPNGQLANQLKQYAPRLFENQPRSQETQPENQGKEREGSTTPEIGDNARTLAALSHVSILFPSIGIFIPMGIYMAQQGKSTYAAFQAFQAAVWHGVAFVFNMLASTCMVASFFIPIFIAGQSKNGNTDEFLIGGAILALITSLAIIILGNLVFAVYGIVGAIMSYQGKNFGYPIIANRLKKQSWPS